MIICIHYDNNTTALLCKRQLRKTKMPINLFQFLKSQLRVSCSFSWHHVWTLQTISTTVVLLEQSAFMISESQFYNWFWNLINCPAWPTAALSPSIQVWLTNWCPFHHVHFNEKKKIKNLLHVPCMAQQLFSYTSPSIYILCYIIPSSSHTLPGFSFHFPPVCPPSLYPFFPLLEAF